MVRLVIDGVVPAVGAHIESEISLRDVELREKVELEVLGQPGHLRGGNFVEDDLEHGTGAVCGQGGKRSNQGFSEGILKLRGEVLSAD